MRFVTLLLTFSALGAVNSDAAVIGSYTFNDKTGANDTQVGNALNVSSVVAGASISALGLSSNPVPAYAGSNSVPPTGPDGFGFGNNHDENGTSQRVIFWRRANRTIASSWGMSSAASTSVANAGMHFRVTANTGYDVTVESVLIQANPGPNYINTFQVAGAASGPSVTATGPTYDNLVVLASPVTITAGNFKRFTILWNSGGSGQNFSINRIDINGSVNSSAATCALPVEAFWDALGGPNQPIAGDPNLIPALLAQFDADADGDLDARDASKLAALANELPLVLDAADFGLVGDGVTDDGPAIASMLAAASKTQGPVTFVFPANQQIYVGSSPQRYIFPLNGVDCLTINGGGSTFLLHSDLRFMKLENSTAVSVHDLNIDFRPLPYVEGTIVNVDQGGQRVFVTPFEAPNPPLSGGPTDQDGEQAFFALIWTQGPYSLLSENWTVERIYTQRNGTIIVESDGPDSSVAALQPGEATISIPVPGIAHRLGPGALIEVFDNHDVTFTQIEVWSAPWFVVRPFRNTGLVYFEEFNIRPKPGTNRICSSWRDGFHAKGNSGALRWHNCHTEGMGDDAYNISTHTKRLVTVHQPTRIEVRQAFILQYMPIVAGYELAAADRETGQIIGRAQVLAVETIPNADPTRAPREILTLDQEIVGLNTTHQIWQPAFANPDTVLTHCTILKSCRMQSNIVVDSCNVTALLWYYSEEIEGPGPESVIIRNSVLKRGRGNATKSLIVAGMSNASLSDPLPRRLQNVLIKNCQIYGQSEVIGGDTVTLSGNLYFEPAHPTTTLIKNQTVNQN